MSNLTYTTSTVNTTVANSIEDVCKTLLAIMNFGEEDSIEHDFFQLMKEQNEMPLMELVDVAIAKRYMQELIKHGVPFVHFEVMGSDRDVIVISPSDKERAFAIESNLRVQVGLEIDNKYELDRMMAVTRPGEMQQRFDGLTKDQADFIIQAGKEMPTPVTIVAEKSVDDTYSLFCESKTGAVVSRLIVDMVCNEANHTKEMTEAIASQKYFQKERDEFLNAVETFRERSRGQEAYLFSYSDPSKYMKIKEDGFEYYQHGVCVKSMNVGDNAVLYPDIMKFLGNTIEKGVYKTAEEVSELGGPSEVYKKTASEIQCKNPEEIFSKNLALKKWVSEKFQVENITDFNLAGTKTLRIEDFLKDTPDLNAHAREVILQHKDVFQKQLDEIVTSLDRMSTQKEMVRYESYDMFYVNEYSKTPTTEKEKKEQQEKIAEHRSRVMNYDLYKEIAANCRIDDLTQPKEETKETDTANISQTEKEHTPIQKSQEKEQDDDFGYNSDEDSSRSR